MAAEVFNPVKEEKGGVRARRAIWTTKSLELAVKGLTEGKKLHANPFYDKNIALLKGDLLYQRTDLETQEWLKCRDDLLYFVKNYCKILTPEGYQQVQLRDYQHDYLKHLEKHRLSIFLACRQCGKTVTSALFMLHFICFNIDKAALVVADKYKTAKEILDKAKNIYEGLPYFLKPGIYKWNEGEIVLDNGCRLMAEATTIKSGIGFTYHCVLCDEFAHVPPNILDKFYNNLFPVITASKARFMLTSTQNGRNLFYRLYKGAEQHDNDYGAFKVDWYQVPEWDPDNMCWVERDEEWHRRQVANYGSEEAFNRQFGTNFDIGANTLINQKVLGACKMIKFVNKDIFGVSYSNYWFWHPDFDPMELKKEFIITTCDLAEGLDQDYTVFSVFRMVNRGTNDLECIGYFRANGLAREYCAESLMNLYMIYAHPDHSLISFEKNTYGDIFLRDINELSDKKYPDWDPGFMVKYYNESGTKFHYGIKITSGNKTPHCTLFKESFERGKTINEAEHFIYELENFCDDGTGHYKASFGHDDMVMTAVQLEFVRKELQYRMMRDDYDAGNSYQEETIWNPYDLDISELPNQQVMYGINEDETNALKRLNGY